MIKTFWLLSRLLAVPLALPPRGIPQPLSDHPGIELCFGEGDRYVDLLREGFDCAVRVGHLADTGDLVARRLAMLEEATCASPAYLARHGVPERADALDGHRTVGFRSSATGAVLPLEFAVAGRVRTVSLPVSVAVGGAETYVAAACAGLGLIQVPRHRLEEDFRRGLLVPVLEATPPTPTPVSVVYPRAKHLSPRLRVFIDWLAGRFRAEAAAAAAG